MTSKREEVEIVDGAKSYYFVVAPTPAQDKNNPSTGKLISFTSKAWEPADGDELPWRIPIHPWKAGLAQDRIQPHITFAGDLRNRPTMVYAKANADASNPNYITAPPAITQLRAASATYSFFNTAPQLRYDYQPYWGTTWSGGALNTPPAFFFAVKNFNGKVYIGGGQYLYSINTNLTFTQVKDFGAGKTIYDMEPFNNELIIAMGETEKIWKMTTSEVFTQATDATYAIALGVTEDELWRAYGTNLLSNCITAPLILTSWVPSAGSEYTAGNTNYSITALDEYRGEIVAFKPDGAWFPDSDTKFHNQTPQLQTYPHADNCKGFFKAGGYLYVPSVAGLLQISLGQSIPVGPELSLRPDYRFWVRAGIEWQGNIYLLCHDQANEEQTFICKMMKDTDGLVVNPFIYHEWVRLGDTAEGHVLLVYTDPTNPVMVAGHSTGVDLMTMGRGSGPDVEDPNYPYGSSFELESGKFIPSNDLGIQFDLIGVKVVGKQITGGAISIYYDVDDSGTYKSFLSNQDGSGIAPIDSIGFFSKLRYATPNTVGNILQIKITGSVPAGLMGENRTEVHEVWAFGNSHPSMTDIITIGFYANRGSRIRGLLQGLSSGSIRGQFINWRDNSKIVELRIPDYDENETVRVQVVDVSDDNIQSFDEGGKQVNTAITKVIFRRIDYSGTLDG